MSYDLNFAPDNQQRASGHRPEVLGPPPASSPDSPRRRRLSHAQRREISRLILAGEFSAQQISLDLGLPISAVYSVKSTLTAQIAARDDSERREARQMVREVYRLAKESYELARAHQDEKGIDDPDTGAMESALARMQEAARQLSESTGDLGAKAVETIRKESAVEVAEIQADSAERIEEIRGVTARAVAQVTGPLNSMLGAGGLTNIQQLTVMTFPKTPEAERQEQEVLEARRLLDAPIDSSPTLSGQPEQGPHPRRRADQDDDPDDGQDDPGDEDSGDDADDGDWPDDGRDPDGPDDFPDKYF